MDTNHTVTLPEHLIQRCMKRGKEVVAGYQAGRHERSRSVSYRGAENNAALQANAKMAECAFCLWADLDPDKAVHWANHADAGHDVKYRGSRLDIKWIEPGRKYLIWSKAKNQIFPMKQFDAFVLVRGLPPMFSIRGWISKQEFSAWHGVAPRGHLLDEGTWYLHERHLWSMDAFSPPFVEAA